ncbi:hypothetical protein PUNSTDRAFT_117624 [Punctularia strigosozonata HHB-11173 SS5]|uniref:uncharacterized protein n=1 Tax=Punctularia strigosozonata (strain HHB-11173) TaxID=741275 RepID=UPI0004417D0B|nr:uncharacterized protein PUNSTDRAFT_117624 [Punctularia strigosozonata HHB-11173 SS5]EIN14013.1 hypothetical protein PUNSTDRAFT_117624 [Punctularia strigosozonata HHB-11173 SS5]
MSFQRFRIQGLTPSELPPQGLAAFSVPPNTDSANQQPFSDPSPRPGVSFRVQLQNGGPKLPYGSGDMDDGYTLVFPTIDAFQAWRAQEEEVKVVEFVKGDTHISKAVPPRFKEHTKLVCARHNRSGRKKYVKKFPERKRKVPSRKIEGTGCPASISYKTYHDSPEVRVMYISDHSHEIGPANLPFTRKGRKIINARSKSNVGERGIVALADTASAPASASGPSTGPSSAISMIAPLPHIAPAPPTTPVAALAGTEERWDRIGVLFQSIRERARDFNFPAESVHALESVLIRMYLESPVASSAPHPSDGGVGPGEDP